MCHVTGVTWLSCPVLAVRGAVVPRDGAVDGYILVDYAGYILVDYAWSLLLAHDSQYPCHDSSIPGMASIRPGMASIRPSCTNSQSVMH